MQKPDAVLFPQGGKGGGWPDPKKDVVLDFVHVYHPDRDIETMKSSTERPSQVTAGPREDKGPFWGAVEKMMRAAELVNNTGEDEGEADEYPTFDEVTHMALEWALRNNRVEQVRFLSLIHI